MLRAAINDRRRDQPEHKLEKKLWVDKIKKELFIVMYFAGYLSPRNQASSDFEKSLPESESVQIHMRNLREKEQKFRQKSGMNRVLKLQENY